MVEWVSFLNMRVLLLPLTSETEKCFQTLLWPRVQQDHRIGPQPKYVKGGQWRTPGRRLIVQLALIIT
jgi:hypothetical protein